MTVEDIFSHIVQHQLEGIMMHEQLANYYDFLGLGGYKRCHEYHFSKETCSYRSICRYYINHYNKLVSELPVDEPNIIPDSWYKYRREEVDASTKRNAVKSGLQKWVEWERETKKFYEQMWQELIEINDISGACRIKELICDVNCELKKAERYWLNKKAVDFSIDAIIAEQQPIHDKYKRKQRKIGMSIC